MGTLTRTSPFRGESPKFYGALPQLVVRKNGLEHDTPDKKMPARQTKPSQVPSLALSTVQDKKASRSMSLPQLEPPVISTKRTLDTTPAIIPPYTLRTPGRKLKKHNITKAKIGPSLSQRLAAVTGRVNISPRVITTSPEKLESFPFLPKVNQLADSYLDRHQTLKKAKVVLTTDLTDAVRSRDPDHVTKSIRRKIEEYRKWNEEHYQQRIERLARDVNHSGPKSNRPRKKQSRKIIDPSEPSSKVTSGVVVATVFPPSAAGPANADKDSDLMNINNADQISLSGVARNVASPPAKVPPDLLNREYTAETWHTWRQVNDSYTYSNARKYIDDNDLMSGEKQKWIKQWLRRVNAETCFAVNDSDISTQ